MSRYFNIKITGGTSSSDYSIYYNSVVNSNLALLYPTYSLATGLTLTQLETGSGVPISVPDNATKIILYNKKCEINQTFDLEPLPLPIECFCITVTKINTAPEQYYFCSNGTVTNGKPVYVYTSGLTIYTISWNSTNNYWETSPIPAYSGLFLRSTDPSNLPLSPWNMYGSGGQNYTITATSGTCQPPTIVFDINCKKTDPSCASLNDGSITSLATGGYGGWKYSLDGIVFGNTTGIFTNLTSGNYTVYAKDISGNTTQCSVYLNSPLPTAVNVPINIVSNKYMSSVGNMDYYKLDYTIGTSLIPAGDTVSFKLKMTYNLKYIEPGIVYFNTVQHSLLIDAISQTITPSGSVPMTNTAMSICNPLYRVYTGSNTYKSGIVTVSNTNVVTGSVIYGIDVTTGGTYSPPCATSADLTVNLMLEDLTISNPCDSVTQSQLNAGTQKVFK